VNIKCLTDDTGADVWALYEHGRFGVPIALLGEEDMRQIVETYTQRQRLKGPGPLSAAAEAAVPAFVELLGTAALDEADPAEMARRARVLADELGLSDQDHVLALMQAMVIARQEDGGLVASSDLLGGLGMLLDELAGAGVAQSCTRW